MSWDGDPADWPGGSVPSETFMETEIRDRFLALTSWEARAFAAGNYTANGAQTWTVASGDVTMERFIDAGGWMVVTFHLVTTTVGGTPNTALQIVIPNSRIAQYFAIGSLLYSDNGGALTMGFCSVDPTGTTINCFKASGNWTGSTNLTSVQGTIIIPATVV